MSRVGAVIASLLLLAACVNVASVTPAPSGTAALTEAPTAAPTPEATEDPTPQPTEHSTPEPTDAPTPGPTEQLTPGPTDPAIACGQVEFPTDLGREHLQQGVDFSGAYSSSPPTSGMHDPVATTTGTFHEEPQRAEEVVHAMEHGAVVFWANGLPEEQETAARTALADIFAQGYASLVWTPYAEMDVPFAMTAWGALQKCTDIDPAQMQAFVDTYYGSGGEGFFACSGTAAKLPACTEEQPSPAATDDSAFPDAAEAALLKFVPEAFRATCVRPFAETVGATADVDCFPEELGADQVSYAQFPSTETLDASYEEARDLLAVESGQGQCSEPDQWPAEGAYTIGALPAGRLLCTESFGASALMWWTDTELNIKSSAISSEGDEEALYSFWFSDSGPVRP